MNATSLSGFTDLDAANCRLGLCPVCLKPTEEDTWEDAYTGIYMCDPCELYYFDSGGTWHVAYQQGTVGDLVWKLEMKAYDGTRLL